VTASDRANPRIGVLVKSIVRVLAAVGAARNSGPIVTRAPSNRADVTSRQGLSSSPLRLSNTPALPSERAFDPHASREDALA
jgi:hypothetical protein